MMKPRTRRLLLLGALALVVVFLAVRVDRARTRANTLPAEERAPSVRTAVVRHERVERRLSLVAEVRAGDSAEIAAEVNGRVVDRLVDPGDRVRRGQALLRLEDALLSAEVAGRAAERAAAGARAASAAAELDFAETSLDRDRTLFAGGAVSREALERAELGRDRAAASRVAAEESASAASEALRGARERLADTVVRAPWDGAVVSVDVAPGDLAAAGRPVVRLVRDGPYRVVARLPQEAAAGIAPGSPVLVTGGGGEHLARVSRVAAGLDRSGLAMVEADLPGRPAGLADGASVRLSLALSWAAGLTVPVAALLEGDAGATVFRLDGDGERPRLEAIAVVVRLRGGERAVVEVLGAAEPGLSAGDRVVVEHPSLLMTLTGGMEVRPVSQPAAPVLVEPS